MRVIVVGETERSDLQSSAPWKPVLTTWSKSAHKAERFVWTRITGIHHSTVSDHRRLRCSRERSRPGKIRTLRRVEDKDFQISLSNKPWDKPISCGSAGSLSTSADPLPSRSGVLSEEPMKGQRLDQHVNAGLEGSVRAAALELPRGFASTLCARPGSPKP